MDSQSLLSGSPTPSYTAQKLRAMQEVFRSNHIYIMLIFIPFGIVSGAIGINPTVVFVLNVLAIIPLAMLLSFATEELSENAGQTIGALLNATFGNAVEMIVSTVALQKGEIRIVQSSMLGAILSNVLLGLGCCLFIGGFRQDCYFNATAAQTMSSLLAVASVSLMIPTALTFAYDGHDPEDSLRSILVLSRGTAIILLEEPKSPDEAEETKSAEKAKATERVLTPKEALVTLFLISITIAICAEYLVGAIDDVVITLGINKAFIGLIVLPIIGNLAEYISAAIAASRNKMDLALGVSLGSSLQIALFVCPALVLLGCLIGQPMSLSFEPSGAAVFFLAVIVVTGLVADGESNYLEGAMLVGTYMIISLAFFVFPVPLPII